ncbi:MAG: 5'-methylthioadenosine/S-adenosylhomocysteine nucleosidase family protein [Pseudolabrys sp.]
MYFDDRERRGREVLVPTLIKTTSATSELQAYLLRWAATASETREQITEKEAVAKALSNRRGEAITFSYFEHDLLSRGVQASGSFRRVISQGYTTHYGKFGTADIPTGIREFYFFDSLSENFPIFDVDILVFVLRRTGFLKLLELPWTKHQLFWGQVLDWRGHPSQWLFRMELANMLSALMRSIRRKQKNELHIERQIIISILQSAFARVQHDNDDFNFDRATGIIRSIIGVLSHDREFSQELEVIMNERNLRTCDVLLVVATTLERDAVLERAQALNGMRHQMHFGKRRTYYDLGYIGGARVLMVQSEMGSVRPGGSLPTVADAIDELKAVRVVMVGIAFGIDEDKQKIGTILVSHQLYPYELQRVGKKPDGTADILFRGDKPSASAMLVGRLRAATAGWATSDVKFGLLLSGEKLVDQIDFREQLKKMAPEAIGGEMEGAGLYSAATERGVDWVIVKAVCDWADGNKRKNKDARQKRAVEQAVAFVLHAITLGGFTS